MRETSKKLSAILKFDQIKKKMRGVESLMEKLYFSFLNYGVYRTL